MGKERQAEVQIDALEPLVRITERVKGNGGVGFLPEDPARSIQSPGQPVNLYDGLAILLRDSKVQALEDALSSLLSDAQAPEGSSPGSLDPITAIRASAIQAQLRGIERADPSERDLSDRDKAWLRAFVLRPKAFSYRRDLTRDALADLERDAFKLWGLPGRESYNAHLLPVRARSATDAKGSQLPPAGFTYRYFKRTTPVAGTREVANTQGPLPTAAEIELREQRSLLERLSELIFQRAIGELAKGEIEESVLGTGFFKSLGRAVTGRSSSIPGQLKIVKPEEALKELEKALKNDRGAWGSGVQAFRTALYRDQVVIDALKEIGENPIDRANMLLQRGWKMILPEVIEKVTGGELGQRYGTALVKVTELEAQVSAEFYDRDLAVRLARIMLDMGEKIRTRQVKGRNVYLLPQVQDGVRILGELGVRLKAFKERNARGEATADVLREAEDKVFLMATHFVNRRRAYDSGLRLEDASLGLWRSQTPVGHLDREDVPDLSGALLVPRAVAVRFGVTGKPSLPGVRTPTASARLPWAPDDQPVNLIPAQVLELVGGESLGMTVFAFRLGAKGLEEVGLSDLPGDRGVPLYAPELKEILYLPTGHGAEAPSNREELLPRARAVAAAALGVPDFAEGFRRTYLRPHQAQPDGWIAGVEWVSAPGGGSRTVITAGVEGRPFEDQNKTRVRGAEKAQDPARRPEESDLA